MSMAVRLSSADLKSEPATATETGWVWECPCCGESYESDLEVCVDDGTPLRKAGFSLPFIWLG
jgi:hypothetical protein